MTEDTQNTIWSALFIIILMAAGALLWGTLKFIKRVVVQAFRNAQEKVARQEKAPAK